MPVSKATTAVRPLLLASARAFVVREVDANGDGLDKAGYRRPSTQEIG